MERMRWWASGMRSHSMLLSLLSWTLCGFVVNGADQPSWTTSLLFGDSMPHYHNHEQLEKSLKHVQETYSERAYLYSIGESVEKRHLWVLAISAKQPSQHVLLRSEVAIIANIHGDEAVGRELLVYLANYLSSMYGRDENVTRLLDNTRVHILPSANPDGFAFADGEGHCQSRYGRENAHGVDLNRDFPDRWHNKTASSGRKMEPETMAIVQWLQSVPFVLAANLHGGALVASYPWDGVPSANSKYSTAPDDDVLRHLALTYSERHPIMSSGLSCNGQAEVFPKGITNGADWYPAYGSLQDYQYAFRGTMALTIEVSCCKYPVAASLQDHWNENKDSLLAFLEKANSGIRGRILNDQGEPVPNAKLSIIGRDISFQSSPEGEFWRILLPGSYAISVQADGYLAKEVSIMVTDKKKEANDAIDIYLEKIQRIKRARHRRKM